jgi:hypothetical protein
VTSREIGAAVGADLTDVVPDLAGGEVHPAGEGSVCVWALSLRQHPGELLYIDPPGALARAIAGGAGQVAHVWLAVRIDGFANGDIGLTLAVIAGGEDVHFEHSYSFLKKKNPD